MNKDLAFDFYVGFGSAAFLVCGLIALLAFSIGWGFGFREGRQAIGAEFEKFLDFMLRS